MDYADRRGIVVIDGTAAVGMNLKVLVTYGLTGIPSTYTEDMVGSATQRTHLQAIRELVARDRNHPSVVLWCVANEYDAGSQEAHDYFARLFVEVRRLDPTRPVGYVNMIQDRPDVCRLTELADVVMLQTATTGGRRTTATSPKPNRCWRRSCRRGPSDTASRS
ncbi:glycoside hydrolase family 2 TIM barrel-domain containing protein [Yinghuangia aomiensis]